MRTKRTIKGLLMVFAMAMVLSLTGITAEAAKNSRSVTLLTGESVDCTVIGIGTIKSAKSNKSKVVAAKKSTYGAKLTGKKKGSAKVVLTGSRGGKFTYNVTVKKRDFKVKLETLTVNGDLIVSVKNNTSVNIDDFYLTLNMTDMSTGYMFKRSADIYCVGAKKTGYACMNTSSYASTIDWDHVTYTLNYRRGAAYKYTNYEKKVNVTAKESGNYVNITAKTKKKYNGNGTIYVGCEVTFYDAAGNRIDIKNARISLYKNQQSNTTQIYKPAGAVRWTVKKRIMLKDYVS